jgi:hypothetical protein
MDGSDDMLLTRYQILAFFEHDHLHPTLRDISRPFWSLAWQMANMLPYCAETSTCLRKLLEAKDCAVRAALDLDRKS